MDFTGKKVLIAGGAGFIGTNLALALAKRGARLRLAVHEKPLQAAIPGAEVVTLDLRQPDHCARAVEGMDYVFLCAAHTSGAAVIRSTPLVHISSWQSIPSQMFLRSYWPHSREVILSLLLPQRSLLGEVPFAHVNPSHLYQP